jgi:CheY-like chemotaxis protein
LIDVAGNGTGDKLRDARNSVVGDPETGAGEIRPRRSVLYVEDNPANLKLVKMILRRYSDVELLTASSAERGLELLRFHRPSLILLDINLPGMNGYDMLERMKRDDMTRCIPVVAISANALPKDVERGYAAGFVDYLIKPIRVEGLLRTVETRMASAHAPEA